MFASSLILNGFVTAVTAARQLRRYVLTRERRELRRRVIASDPYMESLAKLEDSQENVSVLAALLLRAANYPEMTPTLPDSEIRILKARRYGPYPPLRLFYWLDEEAVHLLYVEHYDELLPSDVQ